MIFDSMHSASGAAAPALSDATHPTVWLARFHWAGTSLGPASEWQPSLKGAIGMMMAATVPMVMLVGPDGVLIYNEGYARFAGDRHPAIFGQSAVEAWPEIADFNRHKIALGLAGETLTLTDQELVLDRHGRLEPVWLDLSYSPVPGDDGTPVGVLVIVVETTQRVLYQQALSRSQERMELALGSSALVGTWDWDFRADKVTADPRFAALYGIDVEQAAEGVSPERFVAAIHPDDRERVFTEIAAAVSGKGPYRSEYRVPGSNGAVHWIVASGQVRLDVSGRPERFPGVAVDISDQKAAAEALAASEARFRTLANAMPQMVWATRPDGFHDYFNARWYEFTGVPEGATDGDGWNGMVHPDDQERASTNWRMSLATGEPYHIEYRLRHWNGEYRWLLGRALPIRDGEGRITRWFGTCTDIHESKLAAVERELITQELSHRIKNIFAVITGLVGLSARAYPEAKVYAEQLRARIFALSRSHDVVRPHSAASQAQHSKASLAGLVKELLSPYGGDGRQHLHFSGDDATIDDGAATPLGLLFHELATNSAKHGALSDGDGRIEIDIRQTGDRCQVTWKERGGPEIDVTPELSGFGSKLITLSVEGQLRGTLKRHWEQDGLRIDLDLPMAALNRSAGLSPTATPQPSAETA